MGNQAIVDKLCSAEWESVSIHEMGHFQDWVSLAQLVKSGAYDIHGKNRGQIVARIQVLLVNAKACTDQQFVDHLLK